MDEHVVDVIARDGTPSKGIDQRIKEQNEPWAEFTLEDGTILRAKVSLLAAARVMGKFDANGFPEYALKFSQTVTFVYVPDSVKQARK